MEQFFRTDHPSAIGTTIACSGI